MGAVSVACDKQTWSESTLSLQEEKHKEEGPIYHCCLLASRGGAGLSKNGREAKTSVLCLTILPLIPRKSGPTCDARPSRNEPTRHPHTNLRTNFRLNIMRNYHQPTSLVSSVRTGILTSRFREASLSLVGIAGTELGESCYARPGRSCTVMSSL